MHSESVLRALFAGSAIALLAIRIRFQRSVESETVRLLGRQRERGLVFGAAAALVAWCFGMSHVYLPGRPAWAYAVAFPLPVRWLGAFLLLGGVMLLHLAHRHLALNPSSFVRVREGHTLVQTGPYRWIRHPIYTAYFMSYLGGGLVTGNWVLAAVPFLTYAAMIGRRGGTHAREVRT